MDTVLRPTATDMDTPTVTGMAIRMAMDITVRLTGHRYLRRHPPARHRLPRTIIVARHRGAILPARPGTPNGPLTGSSAGSRRKATGGHRRGGSPVCSPVILTAPIAAPAASRRAGPPGRALREAPGHRCRFHRPVRRQVRARRAWHLVHRQVRARRTWHHVPSLPCVRRCATGLMLPAARLWNHDRRLLHWLLTHRKLATC